MTTPILVRAGILAAALLLATTGCNSHKSATSTPSAVTPARSAPATAAAAPAPVGTTRGAIPGPKTCPAGDSSGVIGGKNKCLAAGQQCSIKNAADYPQYGFVCTPNGATNTLKKKP